MEFRQHSGTLNFTKIINWVSFLMAFVDTGSSLAQARRTRPSSSRAFNLIRNAAANIGLDMEWSRGLRMWEIKGEVNGQGYYAQYTNDQLNWCYDGARETNLNMARLADLFYCTNLIISRSRVLSTTPVTESIVENTVSDAGWLTGVDENVKRYFAERELELN